MPSEPAAPDPRRTTTEHAVPRGRGGRGLRWALAAFALYNAVAHAAGQRWWLVLAWAALAAVLLLVQLAPGRLGTRVDDDGVRVGNGLLWGRRIPWDAVQRLAVASPYERWGWLVKRDGRRLPLRGMPAEAVRALAADRHLPVDDPARRAAAAAGLADGSSDGPFDGPFRTGQGRAAPPT